MAKWLLLYLKSDKKAMMSSQKRPLLPLFSFCPLPSHLLSHQPFPSKLGAREREREREREKGMESVGRSLEGKRRSHVVTWGTYSARQSPGGRSNKGRHDPFDLWGLGTCYSMAV